MTDAPAAGPVGAIFRRADRACALIGCHDARWFETAGGVLAAQCRRCRAVLAACPRAGTAR